MPEKLSHLNSVTERLQSMMEFGGSAEQALALIALNLNRVMLPIRNDSDDEEFLIHAGAWAMMLGQTYLQQQCFNTLSGVKINPPNARSSFHIEARSVIDTYTTEVSRRLYANTQLEAHYSNTPQVRSATI